MINDRESTENLNKIRYISAIVQILTLMSVTLFVAVELYGQISIEFSNKATTSFTTSRHSRGAADIVSRLPYQISVLAAFYWVFQLFGGFRIGNVFTNYSVKAFRVLSVCVILIGLNSLLTGVFKGVLDLVFSGGQIVHFDVGVNGTDLLMIGFGLLLHAVALVQQEAKRRTEDLKLIF